MALGPTASLMTSRRFLPLMITQFLGAFNDNLFRSALIILITYKLAAELSTAPAVLNNIALASFIAPYFFFSALAGQLADKYEKAEQIFWIKIWEVGLMILGAAAFYSESLPLLMGVLAGLGLQSTFFGPIKYGILPDLMPKEELLAANALIEAGTFLAILLGTSIGGLVILGAYGTDAIVGLTLSVALLGTMSAKFVPATGRAAPTLKVRRNIFASTRLLLKDALSSPISRPAIIGISWVWTIGSIYLTQIPVITKDLLGGDEKVVTLLLALFSVGVGAGALATNKFLKGYISARLAAPGLLTVFIISLFLYTVLIQMPEPLTISGISDFFSHPLSYLVTLILILLSLAVGLIIVPLYAIIQDKSLKEERSRVVAANNIVNAAFMATGSVIAAALIALGVSAAGLLFITGIAGLAVIPSLRALHHRL